MTLQSILDIESALDLTPSLPKEPERARILIVDDEEEIRSLLSTALGELGSHDVEVACDGRAGLAKLREQRFDLVVTDLMMPEMNGTRLLELSRREFPDVPVVVITGFAEMDTVIEVLRLGAANFITKPFRLTEIREIVDKSIRQKRDIEIPNRILPCLAREQLAFQIPPLFETKTGVIHYLTEKLIGMGICDASGKYFVSVALDEALTNAMFYGSLEVPSELRDTEEGSEIFNRTVYERMGDPEFLRRAVAVEMDLDKDRVVYRITDPGPGFAAPDLTSGAPEPEDLSSLHGRGLLLISCFMDEASFNDIGNQLTLVKRKNR
jgi:CheY-like chemotaxis protein